MAAGIVPRRNACGFDACACATPAHLMKVYIHSISHKSSIHEQVVESAA